jgi:DNA-binding transcriptional MerR regulator
MQEILFYRELDFSLKSIREILTSPNYNKAKALKEQKQLLIIKKERLERLISAIDDAEKGKNVMKAFDNSEFERYKVEAQERWGNTDAYKEYSEKSKSYGKDKWSSLVADMDIIFSEFSICMNSGKAPDSEEALGLVKKLQSHITENYYNCTKEILSGLGQMYVADERFKNNIDKYAEGTAAFVCEAITHYSNKL